MRRVLGAALACGLVLGACTDDGDPSAEPAEDDAVAVTTTTEAPSAAAVRLNQLLLRGGDLQALGFEPVVVARPFNAQRADRISLCGEDIRSELRTVSGRQSRFSDGTVEVSHTVTSGGDTNAFLDRFRAAVESCVEPWFDPALPTGGGAVQREITGPYPLPDAGVEGAGIIVRSRNQVGATDTIVAVLVEGAVVSSLSVSGPVGSDFDVVDPAIAAAAERLAAGQSVAAP